MKPHLWVRAESRQGEQRVGVTPDGVRALVAAGFRVTVEKSSHRTIGIEAYRAAGCDIAEENSWPGAPRNALIFGLKELRNDGIPLRHRHIMFGHAYKGQADGAVLLRRFKAGGGALYDLEYLTDENGRRVAAFGYWAGFAGAAMGVKVWTAQQLSDTADPEEIGTSPNKDALLTELRCELDSVLSKAHEPPTAIVIGALGRAGRGACDLFEALGVTVTKWDMAETAHGGPFPEILDHAIFVNCVLAAPGIPVFVAKTDVAAKRRLTAIADVSCDPTSAFNPIPLYNRATSFADPVIRATSGPPPLDITAIDNLPSMLPLESSQDFAAQLLPFLLELDTIDDGIWGRAGAVFKAHCDSVG